jgi:hypothetical protein
MIKCGHCKGRHATVNDIRQCAAPIMPTATRAPVHPVRLRDAVAGILSSTAGVERMVQVGREHRATVPFVGYSDYMAAKSYTVSCSCGWSRTLIGSENALWAAFYAHHAEVLAYGENQPEIDLAEAEMAADQARELSAPAMEGMYIKSGEIYKIQKAVHGSGHLYAKRLDKATQRFEYATGMVRQLTQAHKMTLAEAKEYGALYGVCCVCARTLTNEESIAAGIGPTCAGRIS